MSGRYQAYPEYKNLGTDWMGMVPGHWDSIAIGRLFARLKRTDHVDKELLSVYRDHGVVPKSSRDDNNNKPSDDLAPYQLVQPNDLVLNKMKTWQGSIAISEYEGIVSPAYFVYKPNAELFAKAHPKYIHYLLRNPLYIAQYLRRSKGIRVNQWDLDPDEFKLIELLLPQKDEQIAIINFLDHETAKIDTLIDKQQQLIKLLKEKRQAVISHAVTKGLNPAAPMKDSGVEWLGEVPEGWEVKKLKYLVTKMKAGPFGSALKQDVYVSKGYRVYGQEQVIPADFSIGDYYIDQNKFVEMVQYKVEPGDLLISCVGTFGKIAIFPEDAEPGIINPRLIKMTPASAVNPEYLEAVLKSSVVYEQLSLLSRGGTMDVINIGILSEIVMPAPTIEEQEKLLIFYKKNTQKFDELISKANFQINLLQERRTALISAAVTGKIDVRNWQPAG